LVEVRAVLIDLSSAPRLAGDGAGAVNICKSLATTLCCTDQAGFPEEQIGPEALLVVLGASFPFTMLVDSLELRSSSATTAAVQEHGVGVGRCYKLLLGCLMEGSGRAGRDEGEE
jgi:hypothetical protein